MLFVIPLSVSLAIGVAVAEDEIPGGELIGKWHREDRAAVNVTMRVNRQVAGEGRISLRLEEGGERFVGEYIRLSGKKAESKVRRFYVGWTASDFDGLDVGRRGSVWVRDGHSFESFRKRHHREIIATMIGDRGSRMRCRFEVADEKLGLTGGAQGQCQSTNGDVIDFEMAP